MSALLAIPIVGTRYFLSMMDLQQIQIYLQSDNPQDRMKGITALRNHEPEDVVPLLKQRIHDQEFMVRSFVAMGLG